jgi:hypothetical protein
VKLIVQPEDGIAPLINGIDNAKKSVEIAIFRFDVRKLTPARSFGTGTMSSSVARVSRSWSWRRDGKLG